MAVRVVSVSPAPHWDKVEHLRDNSRNLPQHDNELYHQQQNYPDIREAFGTSRPRPGDFLLHYGKGWDNKRAHRTPVLLVHGMTYNANCFVNDYGLTKSDGLAEHLAYHNKKVFAVTFAHSNGDNRTHARIISDAVDRIQEVTGASAVAIVGHSMGGISSRVYVSRMCPRLAPYKGNVKKLITLGTPHLGTDMPFRYPAVNLAAGLHLPLVAQFVNWLNINIQPNLAPVMDSLGLLSLGKHSVSSGSFRGQQQLMYRWDDVYPLHPLMPDASTAYEGGRGWFGKYPGIDKVIADGGHFIERLRQHPLPREVQISTLAGRIPTLTALEQDGVVFVESALHTDDMAAAGAKVRRQDVLPLDHFRLITDERAHQWVLEALNS